MEILLAIFSILILICFGVGFFAGYRLMHPIRMPVLKTFQEQYDRGEIPEAFLKNNRQIFRTPSDYGYDISGFYFQGSNKKTVIFCHGIAWTKYGMAKYLKPFFDEGWNILLYDHRSAGETGGKYPSFGFYEKNDLGKVVEFARKKFFDSEVLGLFGESFGGAVILQYSPIDQSVDFLVTVCPFTSLRGLVKAHLRLFFFPSILDPIVLFFTNLYLWFVGHFQVSDVEPGKDALFSKTPLFLIHGTEDRLVPYSMAEVLYAQRKEIAPTTFLSIKNAVHTPGLYIENKRLIEEKLREFLGRLEKN